MVVIAVDAVSPALWFYIILSRTGKGQSRMLNLRDHGCHIPLWLRGDACEPGSGLMVASHSDPACSLSYLGWGGIQRMARWQKHLQLLLSQQDFKAWPLRDEHAVTGNMQRTGPSVVPQCFLMTAGWQLGS